MNQVGELDLLSACAGDAGWEAELHGPGAGVHAGTPRMLAHEFALLGACRVRVGLCSMLCRLAAGACYC